MHNIAVFIVLLAVFISYVIFAPPNSLLIDIEPIAYRNDVPDFNGPLKRNSILSGADHIFVNEIHGPESIARWESKMYTGTFGGQIVRIDKTGIVPIVKIGNGKCDVAWELEKCGRPLGLRFNSKGVLYVVDAYHGLYKVESITSLEPKVTQLLPLSATKNLKGGPSVFFDDISVDEGAGKNGGDVIYISDASTKWDLAGFMYILFEHDNTGRLLKFDTNSQEVSVVAGDFVFPNGVQITDNQEAIIVCDLGRQRLIRVFIKGPKSGKSEVFTKLPGACDNVRRSASQQETYWVAIPTVNDNPSLLSPDGLSERPLLRKILVRLSYFTGTLIEALGNLYNFDSFKSFGSSLKSGILFFHLVSDHGMITEVDANGKIITAYSSPDGQTKLLSEVHELKGSSDERILILGSYGHSYLGKLIVKK